MPKELTVEHLRRAARVLKSVSHPHRLAIVQQLEKGDRPVHRLVAALKLNQAEVSKQLAVLRRGGVVRSRVEGNYRYYSLALPNVVGVLDCMRRHQKVMP